MHSLKSSVVLFIGLTVLLFFIGLSYFNNSIFLDKILVCAFILGLLFFTKTKEESGNKNSNKSKY